MPISTPGGTSPVLRMQSVRFGWAAKRPPIIDIPAFEVKAAETVFISGASGAGKTTLLSLIGCIAKPQHGQIQILGTEITALSGPARDRFRADHLGIVFQQFNLVPYLSIKDNVTLPCRFSRTRRERLATAHTTAAQEAARLLAELELDGADLIDRPVTGLSIGQQQRVAAARALIGGPALIIADEPTSALDEGTRERFLALLFAQCHASNAALLFVSHDTRLAAQFDRQLNLAEINQAAATANEKPVNTQ